MPPRGARTRSYLDLAAGEPWTLTVSVPSVDPATGLVQAAFGAEATPDLTDATGVHQVITPTVQGAHEGLITVPGTTASGNGTATLTFVLTGAQVRTWLGAGVDYSVRVWESATSYWTEQIGRVAAYEPASSVPALAGTVDTIIDLSTGGTTAVLTSITIAPTAVTLTDDPVLTSISITPTSASLDPL